MKVGSMERGAGSEAYRRRSSVARRFLPHLAVRDA